MELEEKSEEAEFYRSKCKNLEDDLQEVKRQNINYRERCHQEIKKKVGIHTTK